MNLKYEPTFIQNRCCFLMICNLLAIRMLCYSILFIMKDYAEKSCNLRRNGHLVGW